MLHTPWRYLMKARRPPQEPMASLEAKRLTGDEIALEERMSPGVWHDNVSAIDPSDQKVRQDGRVILITGATELVAKEYAEIFARAGAEALVITTNQLDKLQALKSEIGARYPSTVLLGVQCDLGSENETDRLFKILTAKFSKIDVIIYYPPFDSQLKTTGEARLANLWKKLEIEMKPLLLLAEYAAKSGEDSNITLVNMTYGFGLETGPTGSTYSMSTLTSCGLIEYLHIEYPNIRAFSLHPGTISEDSPDTITTIDQTTISACFALYLTTPGADFLRGRFISANWTWDELEENRDRIQAEGLLKMRVETPYGSRSCFAYC